MTQFPLKKGHTTLTPVFGPSVVAKRLDGSRCHFIVDVGPGDIVLHGDPAPPKGAQPPIFGPCLLWPNGWMDEDTIWYGGRPRPWRHVVLNGDSAPLERGTAPLPHFSAYVYCGKMAGWIKMPLHTEVDLGPGHIVFDGGQASPPEPEKGHSSPPAVCLSSTCLL